MTTQDALTFYKLQGFRLPMSGDEIRFLYDDNSFSYNGSILSSGTLNNLFRAWNGESDPFHNHPTLDKDTRVEVILRGGKRSVTTVWNLRWNSHDSSNPAYWYDVILYRVIKK